MAAVTRKRPNERPSDGEVHPVDAGRAREAERQRQRDQAAERAQRARMLADAIEALGDAHRTSNSVWSIEQRDRYRAATLVRDEDPRLTRPNDAQTLFNEPAYVLEDAEWKSLRASLAGLPKSRFGANAKKWAARVLPPLVLDGLWTPFAGMLRHGHDVDRWREHLRDPGIAATLRVPLADKPGVDVDTLVEVGARLTGALIDDEWPGGAPTTATRGACLRQLVELREGLPRTFAVVGWYPAHLRRSVGTVPAPPPHPRPTGALDGADERTIAHALFGETETDRVTDKTAVQAYRMAIVLQDVAVPTSSQTLWTMYRQRFPGSQNDPTPTWNTVKDRLLPLVAARGWAESRSKGYVGMRRGQLQRAVTTPKTR